MAKAIVRNGRTFYIKSEGSESSFPDTPDLLDAINGDISETPVITVAGRTGAVVLAESDITSLVSDLALKAPLASPTFTGTVLAPNIKLNTTGNGLYVKEGSNATMGIATLVGGSMVVSTTKVTANSRIFLTQQTIAGVSVATAVCISARTAGTSFTISSANVLDTSVIAFIIMEPA